MGALKTEASVDYSLRMERLLSRSGWVEGLWRAIFVQAWKADFVVIYVLTANLRGIL